MKNYTLFLFFAIQVCFAQSTQAQTKGLADSLANLYQKYFKIEESSEYLQKKVGSINNLEDKLKIIENHQTMSHNNTKHHLYRLK